MSIINHGIDLVECGRIEQMLSKHDERFLDRVFTAAEQAYCVGPKLQIERLSGRFAVKEAVLKLLGTGLRDGLSWTDIETKNDPAGKPLVALSGQCAVIAKELGIDRISVSITHTKDLAVASVIALGGEDGN